MDLTQELSRRFEAAAAAAYPGQTADPALRRSDRADFQANLAMALGKRVGKPPREVAEAVMAGVERGDLIEKLEVAGPGFINITVTRSALESRLHELAADASNGIGRADALDRVVIDYSAPNVAKEMHVGHIRSTVIGDCIVRTLEARGHTVLRQNHVGDWGTPFGMLIEHLVDLGDAALATDAALVADLDGFYKAARTKFDADPGFADRARARVVSLQAGDAPTLALWTKICAVSRAHMADTYRRLEITLDDAHVAGESLYNRFLEEVVRDLEQKGLATENGGAICVFPPGFSNKEGQPLPLIIRKQDGGYGYATTDLAAIRYRLRELAGTRLVYVVGAPQSQHLAMIFSAAKMAGWLAPPARAEHVAFGSILGPDKKMFKTRSGDTVKLSALLDEADARSLEAVKQHSPELDGDAQRDVAHMLGIGAIKYTDLSSDRIKDYVFDWDRMLAFEGNTAGYLMYAHARARSILAKAGEPPAKEFRIAEKAEHTLALELGAFASVVAEVEATLEPHRLCTYLYVLAQTFSTFYNECPVLKAPTPEERRARLLLCELTATTLRRGLSLLGIGAPDRM